MKAIKLNANKFQLDLCQYEALFLINALKSFRAKTDGYLKTKIEFLEELSTATKEIS